MCFLVGNSGILINMATGVLGTVSFVFGADISEWNGLGGMSLGVLLDERKQCILPDLLSPLGMGAENEERLQQVDWRRVCEETGRLDLEERMESEDLKFAYMLLLACLLL